MITILLTESPSPSVSVGAEGGCTPTGVVALDPYVYRDMRWCVKREEYQEFREFLDGACGRWGCCLGCGEERVVHFSRVNGGQA